MLVAALAGAADPFYEHLLSRGVDAYSRKRYADAEQALRNAVFGLLDEPVRLTEALVYLGLCQAATGDDDGLSETFGRLVAVDARFGTYAAIAGPLASAFETEAQRRAMRLGALGAPAKVWLATIPERRVARMEPDQRRAELARMIAAEPRRAGWRVMAGELELADGNVARAGAYAGEALGIDPGNPRALRLRGLASAGSGSWEACRADLERSGVANRDAEAAGTLLQALAELQDAAAAEAFLTSLPSEVRQAVETSRRVAPAGPRENPVEAAPGTVVGPTRAPATSAAASPAAPPGESPATPPAQTANTPAAPAGRETSPPPPTVVPSPAAPAAIWVQAAAVSREDYAAGVRQRVIALGIAPALVVVQAAEGRYFRVRIGPLEDRDAAVGVVARLKASGFRDAFVVRP